MEDSSVSEWRDCQRRVSELERAYAAAVVSYWMGHGPAPDDETEAVLEAMRARVAALLAQALGEFDRRMVAADRRACEAQSALERLAHRK